MNTDSRTGRKLIALSRRERRTVTAYPSTPLEYDALTEDLLSVSDDSADFSGHGYSGPEARGWTEYCGSCWRVAVIHPPRA
jgi:hypothetical protein